MIKNLSELVCVDNCLLMFVEITVIMTFLLQPTCKLIQFKKKKKKKSFGAQQLIPQQHVSTCSGCHQGTASSDGHMIYAHLKTTEPTKVLNIIVKISKTTYKD